MNFVALPDGRLINLDHVVLIESEPLGPEESERDATANVFLAGPAQKSFQPVKGESLAFLYSALEERSINTRALREAHRRKPPTT